MNVLGLFAKYWQPGSVKTRLSTTLGDQSSAAVYREFVLALVRRLAHTADRRTIVFSPAERAAEFAALGGAPWETTPQADGDLGNRMRQFFRQTLDGDADRAVVIGSDSPTLPMELVKRAFSLLDDHDVVLGPTTDGGYYLLGAVGRVPPLFDDIPWSTPAVWRQTIDRLESAGLRYAVLPTWYDVDDLEDLHRLHDELTAVSGDAVLARLRDVVQHALDSPADAASPKTAQNRASN